MQIRKKPIGRLGLGVLCSLSESYMMLPFLVFSSLLTGKSTAVNFFVPVVILYSIQRACLIALRGFGEITNPYRILRGGLLLSLAGAVLMALSSLYRPLLMISALLIGVGLSPVRAMFIPLYTAVTQQDASLRQGKRIGAGLYVLVMLLALILGKICLPVVPFLFLLYIACALFILLRFDGDMLFYRGRIDFQVKFNGYRIELEEINHYLGRDSLVKYGVVAPKYDRNHTVKQLVAVVELDANAKDRLADEEALTQVLRDNLKENVMPYMLPQRFIYRDHLPISQNGKVDIKAVSAEVNN